MRNYFVTCNAGHGLGGRHRVHVTEWGEANNPNVLICAHGLTRCGRDFDLLAAALSDHYRILCPDVVGRGESDWLNDKAGYTYPQYAADMVRVIAQSGARQVHWLGTSMGGIIGMLLAAQANTPITRLVLNDVGPIIPKASLERIAMYVGVSPVFHSLEEAVAAVRTVSPFGPITDAQWLALTRPLLKQRADGSWQFRYDPAIGDAFKGRTLADVDLNPYWRQVHCPTLITRGAESDLLTRETFEAMCAWPNVRGHEFAHTGHAPMFQTAEAIAVVRRFLLEQ